MSPKYILGGIIVLPLLPIMYAQGKRIKASVPELPEASGTSGSVDMGSPKALNLITIGESSVAGVGVQTHEEGFTGTLAKALAQKLNQNVDWWVYARSGYTIRRVTNKIIPTIEEKELDLIVIGMGGNDAFELNNPIRWKKDVKQMVETLRLRYPKTPIVFNNMPPIKDFPAFTPLIKFVIGNLVELFAEELKEVCEDQQGVYFSSEIIKLSNWIHRLDNQYQPEDFFSDGVHPSKLTYQTWANEMANFIVSNVPLASKAF